MNIHETTLTPNVAEALLALSKEWAADGSCRGYVANEITDLQGRRIFVAEDEGNIVGYLFGKIERAERASSIIPDGARCFEIEELYVTPNRRSSGIGRALFRHAEQTLAPDADYLTLSTATKNWRAVMHFYIDEMGMDFFFARLVKPMGAPETEA